MRKAQRIALLATVFVATVGVGAARADWRTERAQAIAAKAWDDPCAGRVTVAFAAPPQAGWRAWTYPARCTVVLSDAGRWRWAELCPVLLHEYGHLAGYRDPENPADPTHSHDPRDIMWPFEHDDARCDDYGAAYLGVGCRPARPSRARRRAHRRKVVVASVVCRLAR